MTLISIRERSGPGGANATVSFDGQGEYPVSAGPPFSDEEEARLEWYFEQHLRFPFTEQVRARAAAASVAEYGERLFKQIFRDNPDVYGEYKAALQAGVGGMLFEIAGPPEFQRLHWEALKDPNLARQAPAEVLAALQAGDEAIDMRSEKKTESILRCIEYSYSNLSPQAQGLLACLAPFTSVIDTDNLPQYTERLR